MSIRFTTVVVFVIAEKSAIDKIDLVWCNEGIVNNVFYTSTYFSLLSSYTLEYFQLCKKISYAS